VFAFEKLSFQLANALLNHEIQNLCNNFLSCSVYRGKRSLMVHELSLMADIMMEDSVWLDDHQSRITPPCARIEHLDNCRAPHLEPNTRRSPSQTPLQHSMHDLTVLQSEDDSHGERERDGVWSSSPSPCKIAEFVDNNGRPAAAKITAALLSRVAVVHGILGNGNGTPASRTISSSSWVSKSCPCLFSEEQHTDRWFSVCNK